MTPRRKTARGFLLAVTAMLLGAGAAAASPTAEVPRLVFPVLGPVSYVDDFGDARGQGGHQGNDLMAPRHALALAAEAGTVKFHTTSSRAGCMLYLYGKSGTTYLYIHLNNDLSADDDDRGGCVPGVAFAKGLRSGAQVAAGQPIGYVGDSGDAEGGSPHLHFEVHPGGGAATSPYRYLQKARKLLFAAERGSTFTLALTGTVLSSAGQALNLKIDQVRSWPGGRRIKQAGQKVAVAVPETASFEGPPGLRFGALELLTQGLPVTVWTKPAKVTLPAQAGEQGALAAARVVVKRP